MTFIKKGHKEIYDSLVTDLKKRLPEVTDFEQGSVIRSLFETIAFEQAIFYEQLDYVYNSAFINTAQGLNLEKVVSILDVYRNEPDYALGAVTFYGTPGFLKDITIPIGTLITTKDNPNENPSRKAYRTIEEGYIKAGDKSVKVRVQAETRGKIMEVKAEMLQVLPHPINGILSVKNLNDIRFTGKDKETDEELRARAKKILLAAGRASQTSIEEALLSMPNILDVKIRENSPGTIDVYVDGIDDNNSKALAEKLDDVKAAGIYAHLLPVPKVNVYCKCTILPHEDVLKEEMDTLSKNISSEISTYISQKKIGESVSITQLISRIIGVKGVKDVLQSNIEMTTSEVDIPCTKEVPTPDKYEIRYVITSNDASKKSYKVPVDTKNICVPEIGRFSVDKIDIEISNG